jgi:hypothetical protein
MEGNRGTPKKLKINRDRERDESEREENERSGKCERGKERIK